MESLSSTKFIAYSSWSFFATCMSEASLGTQSYFYSKDLKSCNVHLLAASRRGNTPALIDKESYTSYHHSARTEQVHLEAIRSSTRKTTGIKNLFPAVYDAGWACNLRKYGGCCDSPPSPSYWWSWGKVKAEALWRALEQTGYWA